MQKRILLAFTDTVQVNIQPTTGQLRKGNGVPGPGNSGGVRLDSGKLNGLNVDLGQKPKCFVD